LEFGKCRERGSGSESGSGSAPDDGNDVHLGEFDGSNHAFQFSTGLPDFGKMSSNEQQKALNNAKDRVLKNLKRSTYHWEALR
jgi:hypothetical protein